MDAYPTTATGKIRRVELRAMAASVLLEPLPRAEAAGAADMSGAV